MVRLLRRVTLALTVFVIGLLLAGWAAVRVIATRVLGDSTEPVRQKVVADWAAHADRLEQDLRLAVGALQERGPSLATPPALGCHLVWQGAAAAVKQHRDACDVKDPTFPADLAHRLATLPDGALAEPGFELPPTELSWLAELRGHEDWSDPTGTPLAHFDVDARTGPPPALAPSVVLDQVLAQATTRLIVGRRAADATAPADVQALGFALLSRPVLADQLAGLAVLERARDFARVTGTAPGGPTDAQLAAMRSTVIAGSQLWSPWVPREHRARFLPSAPAAVRCAAALEAASTLELGAALVENYPDWTSELAAWRADGCRVAVVTRALEARRQVGDERFFDALVRLSLFERGALTESALRALAPRSPLVRRAALESALSLAAVRPFPEAPR